MRILCGLILLKFSTFSLSSTLVENGVLASKNDLLDTATVAIVYEKDGKETSTCTGVRISPYVILTAAHCVYKPLVFPKGVRSSLNPLDERVPVEKVRALKFPFKNFYHRINFEAGYLEDIAILILDKKSQVSFPEIQLPQEGETFLQLGYGMEYHYPRKEIFPLSKLTNGALDLDDFTTTRHFTIRNPKSSMRSGDSGGPILIKEETRSYKLAGVLSSGDPNSLSSIKNGRAIYMSAYHYVDWIRGLIGDESFNAQLGVLLDQAPREESEFITGNNVTSIHERLCEESRLKSGVEWYLSSKGTCLPKDEELCLKMRHGKINFRFFRVEWNSESGRCEEN